MPWSVYIIECKDSKLYTGITTDLQRRIRDHNSGNGCRFTKYRIPVKLVYREDLPTRSEVLKREARIKQLTRRKKLDLAKTFKKESRLVSAKVSRESRLIL